MHPWPQGSVAQEAQPSGPAGLRHVGRHKGRGALDQGSGGGQPRAECFPA